MEGQGYGENRNTWEPLEHLDDEIKEMALRFKQDAEAAGAGPGAGTGGTGGNYWVGR